MVSYARSMGVTGRANRVVRWEILPGLPGDRPVPKYFHSGQPTPWKEGFAVRFWNLDGSDWVENFQAGWTEFSAVIELTETKLAVVISHGAYYQFPLDDPGQVTAKGDGVTGALLSESGLLILTYVTGSIGAVDGTSTPVWTRDDFGADELVLKSCPSGVIVANVQDWEGLGATCGCWSLTERTLYD
jgi:hypothetical protein